MCAQDDTHIQNLFEGSASALIGAEREKLVEAKRKWADEGRLLTGQPDPNHTRRLPPGQQLTTDWPVLDLGTKPLVPLDQWTLTVKGAVERPLSWDWDAYMAQPQIDLTSDIHCVTQWSRYDNQWTGVTTRRLLDLTQPRASASHVVLHSHDGYTTNIRLEQFATDDALLAHAWQGEALSRDHGGPVRLVIPSLYFWKSAKWIRHIAILDGDAPGFWETRGYHNNGDPWKEERYG